MFNYILYYLTSLYTHCILIYVICCIISKESKLLLVIIIITSKYLNLIYILNWKLDKIILESFDKFQNAKGCYKSLRDVSLYIGLYICKKEMLINIYTACCSKII